MAGAAYGFAGMGPFPGGQAEYLRVPYGDFNCLRLPEDAREKLLCCLFYGRFSAFELEPYCLHATAGGSICTKPRLIATLIASVRPVTLSFSRICVMCTLTVASLMSSKVPISLLLLPLVNA
jgi:hypothetical protein